MKRFGLWRELPARQQPDWPDRVVLDEVLADLRTRPPLALPGESNRLRVILEEAAYGRAFILQAGDCAETFADTSEDHIRGNVELICQMAAIIELAAPVPIVKIGRIAGQYAKPRSNSTETRGNVTLPVYRGDAVNAMSFTDRDRTADPRRLSRTYDASATTTSFLRDIIATAEARGFACGMEYAAELTERPTGRGDVPRHHPRIPGFYTSHEALILEYESAFVRSYADPEAFFSTSAHMLWIGERTRQLDGAHVEFARELDNPIAVKLGPSTTPEVALGLARKLNPNRLPGRLTFIIRMGAKRIRDRLPEIVNEVVSVCPEVIWLCDPMHGNTFQTPSGYKTRRFEDVRDELFGFFEVHRELGTHPGGVHLELTGDDVTECIGDSPTISVDDLKLRYRTGCDPRLNRDQAIELAIIVAQICRDRLISRPAGGHQLSRNRRSRVRAADM